MHGFPVFRLTGLRWAILAFLVSLQTVASAATVTVDTVANLATVRAGDGDIAETRGYSVRGVGAARYVYHLTGRTTHTEDGVLYFDGVGADGYWELLHDGVIDVTQAGAVGDGVTDDTTVIQRAIDVAVSSGTGKVYIPAGDYVVSSSLVLTGVNTGTPPNRWIQPVSMFGDGPESTFIKGSVSDLPVIWSVSNEGSELRDFWVGNPSGDSIRLSASHRSRVTNIHSGRGVRDVVFWNDGSQQVKIDRCLFSPQIENKGNTTRAKYGMVFTGFSVVGSAVAGSTGLDGLTLTLNFVAEATVEVSGNTIEDVRDAINGASTTTGLVATVDCDSQLVITTRSFDGATGINDDNDIVLTDGTGTWASAGHTAATVTGSSNALIPNATSVHQTTAEQFGFAGVFVHTPRFTLYDNGNILFNGCVFQGNGYTSGPTYRGDMVLDRCVSAKVFQCHMESTYATSIQLNKAHNTSCVGTYFFGVDIDDTDNASFIACTITEGEISNDSNHTLMIGSEVYMADGSYDKFSDLSGTTRWIAGTGNNATGTSNGNRAYSVSNTMSEVLNYNGKFDYWNGTSHPVGYDASNSATLTQETGLSGTYAVGIVPAATTAQSGLRFQIAASKLKRASATSLRRISVTVTAKRTTATGLPGVVIIAGATQELVCNEADKSFPVDTWVTRRFQGYVSDWFTGTVQVIITPDNRTSASNDGTAKLIIDDVVITGGMASADQYMPMSGENETTLFLQGKYIDYESAAPVSGYWPAGSVRYNDTPVAGGNVGWVCTASGSPGTWKEFGQIDPQCYADIASFEDDTTPSVQDACLISLTGTGPYSVTAFDDGVDGQHLEVHIDANTTISDSGGTIDLDTALAGSFAGGSGGGIICFRRISGVWKQVGEAVNF